MTENIRKIKDVLSKYDQTSLFFEDDTELLETCKGVLQDNGYRVYEPHDYSFGEIGTLNALIELFYGLYVQYHPTKFNIFRSKSNLDRKIAKVFLESRMEASGISKKYAFYECAEIINTIFEFESEFHFKFDISFSILGQKELAWVTEYAIKLMNGRENLRKNRNNKKIQDHLEFLYDNEPESNIGFKNLDTLVEKIKTEV